MVRLSKVNFLVRPFTYGLTLLAILGSLIPPRHIEQITFSLSDKLIHGTYYFLLTLGWLHIFTHHSLPKKIYVVFALWSMGALLECLQAFLPIGRFMDPYDLLANTIGIMIGVMWSCIYFKVR
jgi:VanZ family protein